jgi:hypothetical protein
MRKSLEVKIISKESYVEAGKKRRRRCCSGEIMRFDRKIMPRL